MKKVLKSELFMVTLIILAFIAVRSLNYVYQLNWSGDQATSSLEALKIFRTGALTLIGPVVSWDYQGKQIFTGPLTYYMEIVFLILGGWDPVRSSYFFMLFCASMIIPLYFGTKLLINKKVALLITVLYTFGPYYVTYTRFFWNPTFQLSLMPILVFFMGWYKQKKTSLLFFCVSLMLGILFLFHYQFALIILGVFIYYFIIQRIGIKNLLIFISGITIGFSPLILFELKHNFYNTTTMLLFLRNWSQVGKPGNQNTPHYYTSISLIGILGVLGIFGSLIKKIPGTLIYVFIILLGIYSFIHFYPQPKTAFWASTEGWNYLTEQKIYDIIKKTEIKTNFNVINQAYDNKAIVTKYFLKRDYYDIDYDDYYHNKYVFVICKKDNYKTDPAYEIANFQPNKVLNFWKINSIYNMYLLQRL